MTSATRFTVVGEQKIHCGGCERRIGNALARLPGVGSVEASHRTQRVEATIDRDRVSPEEVRDRLELLGYEGAPEGETA